jgi:hypothetical protein
VSFLLKGISVKTLPRDIFTGIIIALVSIPISMGYAQIAGLPAAYGLYGSIFPILIFSLCSSSPQFIFGVDAAPAALVGAFLTAQGIALGSDEAIAIVPAVTLLVGLWLLLFALLKAGRLVSYISTPVMGGFISGICTTIILMQIPKLLGGGSGTGELPELLLHIAEVCRTSFHPMSLTVGAAAPLQEAVVPGLLFGQDYYDWLRDTYTAKRDLLLSGLDEIGIEHTNPQGAYYVLLDISRFGFDSDLEFCEVLARDVGVGAVPGSIFFHEPVNHLIRLHFAKKDETLQEALERLKRIDEKIKPRT